MPHEDLSPEALAAALRALLARRRTSTPLGPDETTVVDVRPRADDVLVCFRWMAYPHVLAYGLRPGDGYWPAESPEDWAHQARLLLDEELGTGLVARASRRLRDDVIELVGPDLPVDRRFHSDVVHPGPDAARGALRHLGRAGLDPAVPERRHRDGTLIAWHRSSVDDLGPPRFVGQATVSWAAPGIARLEQCETLPGIPATVAFELSLSASHSASWAGARTVVSDLDLPVLSAIGFVQHGAGRVLDTSFLSVDHAAAGRLLEAQPDWQPPPRRGPFLTSYRVGL